ncbi:MAG: Glutamyl-Q tRNA(Asp) synthetase, partial [uncultured Rubrobacteraceae bacterium]
GPTRDPSEHGRGTFGPGRTLRPEPDGAAARREPPDGPACVALRPLRRRALPGAGGGPGPLAGAARGGRGPARRPPGHRSRLGRARRAPVGEDGVVRGGHR